MSTKLIYWEYAATKSRQRMGQGLQNSLVLGSHNHKRVWPQHGRQQVGINPRLLGSLNQKRCENSKQLVGSHPISTRLMLPQQQIWSYQMANNKWALTHVCQTHTASNNNKRQQMGINPCLLHLSNLVLVIGNK
jgi:hypothetical protein